MNLQYCCLPTKGSVKDALSLTLAQNWFLYFFKRPCSSEAFSLALMSQLGYEKISGTVHSFIKNLLLQSRYEPNILERLNST